jgi:FAD binding domain
MLNASWSQIMEMMGSIVGEDNVSDDIIVRQAYGRDPHPSTTVRKLRKDPLTVPDAVVLPDNTEDVRGVMRIASRYGLHVIPMGSGDNLTGCCVPTRSQTIILDMKRMDRILEINEEDKYIRMQPWNSYARVQAETMKRGLWNGGCPAAPASNCIVSNCLTYGGAWQTAQAFSLGARGFIGFTIVLANGDILRTGSHGLDQGDATYWYGPGPDLKSLFEMGALGGLGVITEVLYKLHTWPGGEWPQEEIYDQPPLPDGHRLLWFRFDRVEDCIRAGNDIAYAGIGIGVNIPLNGVNALVGENHQAETVRRFAEGYYEPFWMYVLLAGYSPGQLDYEESVLREIIAECNGEELGEDQRRHMAPYNNDAFRSGDFVRWVRYGIYAITYLGRGPIADMARIHEQNMAKVQQYDLPKVNDSWPFYYSYDRGHFWMEERDLYGDQLDYAEIISKITIDVFRDSPKGLSGYWILREPMGHWYGDIIGPNYDNMLRMVKGVFDPGDTNNPDRLVFATPPEKVKKEGK